MPTFVALLRGVNVGGAKRVPMAELRTLLSGLGYTGVATLLNSGNAVFRADRVGWLRKVFDLSCADFDRLNLDRDDPVAVLGAEFRRGLDGLSEAETRARLVKIERLITEWAKGRKLYGHLYDDLLKLKYLHQRYTNYLRWLKT